MGLGDFPFPLGPLFDFHCRQCGSSDFYWKSQQNAPARHFFGGFGRYLRLRSQRNYFRTFDFELNRDDYSHLSIGIPRSTQNLKDSLKFPFSYGLRKASSTQNGTFGVSESFLRPKRGFRNSHEGKRKLKKSINS